MEMLVLSWNLFHGRALPAVNRSLYGEFAAKLGGWRWDLALLQEVPPWWPSRLARDLEVEQCRALTSRNALLPLRTAIARRRPELLKSNGGGCNAILTRGRVEDRETITLRRLPERRVAQLVRLGDGMSVVNFHASTRPARAERELAQLWRCALAWAGPAPLLVGGDLNLRTPRVPEGETALAHVAGHNVDHLFARGLHPVQPGARPGPAPTPLRLDRETELVSGGRVALSDHEPLLVELLLDR
jgi:endonuclease/exonuclease/phosphatase family metal-dependent hydrolase